MKSTSIEIESSLLCSKALFMNHEAEQLLVQRYRVSFQILLRPLGVGHDYTQRTICDVSVQRAINCFANTYLHIC